MGILHTLPGAKPQAWLGVECSGVTLVQIKLHSTVTVPAHALPISCRKPFKANPYGPLGGLWGRVTPHAQLGGLCGDV